MMDRGDVVLADFPFQDVLGSKVRPAVVVQNDRDNQTLANTILVMITGNLRGSGLPTNVIVDPATPEGSSSGLTGLSLIKCGNLTTINQRKVLRQIGRLSASLQNQVNDALKAALDLP
jgi:mRNA interferase MazF